MANRRPRSGSALQKDDERAGLSNVKQDFDPPLLRVEHQIVVSDRLDFDARGVTRGVERDALRLDAAARWLAGRMDHARVRRDETVCVERDQKALQRTR